MKRYIICFFLIFSVVAFALAEDDFSDFGDFGDSASGDLSAASDDFGDFGDFGADASEKTNPLSFSGSGGLDVRPWINTQYGYHSFSDLGENTKMSYNPFFKFAINYSPAFADFEAKIKLNKWTLGDFKWDILDELTARFYAGDWVFEGGKMRLVWGKGDKLHVLDNFNANDYTDFVIPEYIDRRIAEPMIHIVYNAPIKSNLRLEGVWTPIMTADRFDDDVWKPYKVANLEKTVKSAVKNNAKTHFAGSGGQPDLDGLIDDLSFDSESIYEDISSLKFGQAGLRLTGTVGRVDLGASYYYGHYKQPSANLENFLMSQMAIAQGAKVALEYPELEYDMLHVFGVELATILWKFNIRAEAAYNMTNDFSGDDPWTHNNSISWLLGFDIDLPFSNFNINIQETGRAVLKYDKIGDEFEKFGVVAKAKNLKQYDVDYDSDGNSTKNKFVINISDKYLHEKLTWEITAIIGVENPEVAILPKISYNVKAGFYIVLSGCYLHSDDEDGEFYNFTAFDDGENANSRDKAFVQLGVRYDF